MAIARWLRLVVSPKFLEVTFVKIISRFPQLYSPYFTLLILSTLTICIFVFQLLIFRLRNFSLLNILTSECLKIWMFNRCSDI